MINMYFGLWTLRALVLELQYNLCSLAYQIELPEKAAPLPTTVTSALKPSTLNPEPANPKHQTGNAKIPNLKS